MAGRHLQWGARGIQGRCRGRLAVSCALPFVVGEFVGPALDPGSEGFDSTGERSRTRGSGAWSPRCLWIAHRQAAHALSAKVRGELSRR
jgi:hypothetical protein